VLKVLCLQLYFRNYVRSDVSRLGNSPAFRRQLSLESRIRMHCFIFVSVISDGVEVLNVNALDFFLHGPTTSSGPRPPRYRVFTITLRHTAPTQYDSSGRVISPTQRSLTKYNYHKRQISMPPARFELTIPVVEQRQGHVLDRVATWIGEYS